MRHRLLAVAATLLFSVPIPASAQMSFDGGGVNGGFIRPGASSSTCDGTTEGAIRWNTTDNVIEFCDGTTWRAFVASSDSGTPSTPSASAGYFVLTNDTWNGNLGGLVGANAKCLADLTTYDWMGKTDATTRGIVTASKVRAWLCQYTTCNNAIFGTEYFFAVAGDNTKGGASFTADGSGVGPGNTQNWSGTNYFDGAKTYWTGRSNGGTTTWTGGNGNSLLNCTGFGATTNDGYYGNAASTGSFRWSGTILAACTNVNRLVCFVDP